MDDEDDPPLSAGGQDSIGTSSADNSWCTSATASRKVLAVSVACTLRSMARFTLSSDRRVFDGEGSPSSRCRTVRPNLAISAP